MIIFRAIFGVLAMALILAALVFALEQEKQDEIERRAYKIPNKECYTWQDIEYIVHGEIQE